MAWTTGWGTLFAEPEPGGTFEKETSPSPVQSYSDRWAVVPLLDEQPVVDGTLEQVWSSAYRANGFVTMYDNVPVASDTDVYLFYDEAHLYVGMEGHDDQPGQPVETEIVELFLSPGGDAPIYRLKVPIAAGGREIATDWGKSVTDLEGVEAKTVVRPESWTLEAKIPFRSLGVDRVSEADEWKFNVVRYYGINSKPFSSFVPIRRSYIEDLGGNRINLVAHALNQERMAPLYFSRPPSTEADPEIRSQAWHPPQWTLLYTGYQNKDLVFTANAINSGAEIRMVWESPDGTSTELQAPRNVRNKNETHLSFEHPRPLANGLYRLKIWFRHGNGVFHFFEISFDRHALIEAGNASVVLPDPPGPKQQVPYAPPSEQVLKLMELIPENTGFIFTGLPEDPTLRPYQLYTWSPDQPTKIVSKTTGTVYPNEQYPETKKLTVTNRKGELVEYPYYEDEEGRRYFFTAHVWYFQKDYALRETAKLADTDPLGAARLLARWADVYEGYLPTNDYYWTNYPLTGGPPYHYWGGVWYRWYTGDMTNLSFLITAYEKVRKTNAFELLSQETGRDEEKRLVDKLFKPSFDYVRSFPILNHNLEYNTWLGLIRMAKATGNPAYMHEAVELIQDFARNNFLSDGFWKEVTLSYHNQSTNGLLQSLDLSKGWTDPAGYASPRNGLRIDNLDLTQSFPALGKAKGMGDIVSYSNGSYVPIQDTWANEKSQGPRNDLGSYLLPSSGISRLTLGDGADQQQLYLYFVPKYGHNHLDPLNLNLFAEGQELLPDIGYTHTFFRKWTSSTLAHNTVVVDGRDMTLEGEGQHGGQIESFLPIDETVKIFKARQPDAYPVTSEYSREPWLIGFGDGSEGKGYVVDIFRVSGGSRHEYTLGGDANRDADFRTNLTLQPYNDYLLPPGTEVRMPESENDYGDAEGHYYGYIYVQDVMKADVPDGNYELTLETRDDSGAEQAKLKIVGMTDPGMNELFIGRSPSLRATRLYGTSKDINTEALKYTMPKFVLRRTGTDLSSTFVTVMEAYPGTGAPRIERIERLVPDQFSKGDVALKISYGTTTDIILSSAEGIQPLRVGDIVLEGKYGFIRMENGEVTKMVLADGTKLGIGDHVVVGTGSTEGTVKSVLRTANGDPFNALVTDVAVPPEAAGQMVVVTHADRKTFGYKIKEIRQDGGKTLIVLDDADPGWEVAPDGRTQMVFYPFHVWDGAPSFHIENVIVR